MSLLQEISTGRGTYRGSGGVGVMLAAVKLFHYGIRSELQHGRGGTTSAGPSQVVQSKAGHSYPFYRKRIQKTVLFPTCLQ